MFDLMGDGIDRLQTSTFASSWLGGIKNHNSQKIIPKITNIRESSYRAGFESEDEYTQMSSEDESDNAKLAVDPTLTKNKSHVLIEGHGK
jgi:hypothetical protein